MNNELVVSQFLPDCERQMPSHRRHHSQRAFHQVFLNLLKINRDSARTVSETVFLFKVETIKGS